MKRPLFTIFIVFCFASIAFSQREDESWQQEVQDSDANFYEIREHYEEEFSEQAKSQRVSVTSSSSKIVPVQENEHNKYRRWEWYMSSHVNPDGSLPTSTELEENYERFVSLKNARTVGDASSAKWDNISRTTNSGGYWGMGRTSHVAFHPTQANTFWVSGQTGGVWKTTDGGKNYTPQGDDLPFLGAGAMVVDRSNPNTLYVCTGDNTGGIGVGIYRSTNGGASWSPTGFTNNLSDRTSFYGLVQSPSDASVLLVATDKGLYRTTDRGANWTQVKSGRCTDVEFQPGSGGIVYAMFDRTLHKSTNGGTSFSVVSSAPVVPDKGLARIAVTKANANRVLIWSREGIWVSTNAGGSWSQKNFPKDIHDNNKEVGLEAMIISPNDPNILYGGRVDFFRSDDNGNSWEKIGRWAYDGVDGIREVHADHRNIVNHPLTGEIFSCNDGGVDKYNEGSNTWSRLSNGLVIPQYYSAASAETNGTIIGVGSQDNGGSRRLGNLSWRNTNGGDAGTQAIDPNNADISYSNYNPSPYIIRTLDGWTSTTEVKPDGKLTSWWVIPYTLDPNNSRNMVVAYHAIYRSTNRGDSWTKISPDFAPIGDYWKAFRTIAMAPSNSNYIYAGTARTLYFTSNNGSSWDNSSVGQDISSICVSPDDPKVVYITCSQFASGNKVFKSTNGGSSWTNISSGLPNIPVHSITYQRGSNELLYIGTDFGVFYKDASMDSWEVYGEGLPRTMVDHVHINYNQQKLRAATYGRGIYETDLLDAEGCTSPANVVASAITASSLKLSWSAVSEASNYYIYYKKHSDSEWTRGPNNLTSPTVELTGLDANTLYDTDVWATCTDGQYKSTRVAYSTAGPNGLQAGAVYEIKSALSANRALDIEEVNSADGANAFIWKDSNGANQRWKVDEVENGFYKLVPQHAPDKALDLNAGVNENGTNVQIWRDHGEASQRWKIVAAGKGRYKIHPEDAPTRCLDVTGGSDQDGANVQIWDDNGGIGQRWIFEMVQPAAPSANQFASAVATSAPTLDEEATTPRTYPNPADEQFNIHYVSTAENGEALGIKLTNNLGVVVKELTTSATNGDNDILVATGQLPTGIYTLVITDWQGKNIHAQRMLIR